MKGSQSLGAQDKPADELVVKLQFRIRVKVPQPTAGRTAALVEQTADMHRARNSSQRSTHGSSQIQETLESRTVDGEKPVSDGATSAAGTSTSTERGRSKLGDAPQTGASNSGAIPLPEIDLDDAARMMGAEKATDKDAAGGSLSEGLEPPPIVELSLEELPPVASSTPAQMTGPQFSSQCYIHFKWGPEEYGNCEQFEPVIPPSARMRRCCSCCARRRARSASIKPTNRDSAHSRERTTIGGSRAQPSPRTLRSLSLFDRVIKVYDTKALPVRCPQCSKSFNVHIEKLTGGHKDDTIDEIHADGQWQ